jgi:hypothetical protein
MSLISEGHTGRARDAAPPIPPSDERPQATSGSSANTVHASQARAALRREARRDEQAVATWLRQLARPSR